MAIMSSFSTDASGVETLLATGSWVFCSIGMTVFNKLAIQDFPYEWTLVGIQMLCTVLAMLAGGWSSLHIGSAWDVLRWCRVVPFFVGVLLTSILALKEASITLVVVFRCFAPLVSLAVEQFYPNPLSVNRGMLLSMLGILVGAALYCNGNAFQVSDWRAIGWVLLNNFFVIGDRLLQRLMLAKDQMPVDISKSSVTLLNNGLGLIPIVVMATFTGEASKVLPAAAELSVASWLVIAFTCVAGVGIAYTGIWTQSLISATSFLILATGAKFFVVLIDIFVLKSKVLTPIQLLGAIVTILASVAYGQARVSMEKSSEKTPLVKKDTKETA